MKNIMNAAKSLTDNEWHRVETDRVTISVNISGTATVDVAATLRMGDTTAEKTLYTGLSASDMLSIPYPVQAVRVTKTSGTGTVTAWVFE